MSEVVGKKIGALFVLLTLVVGVFIGYLLPEFKEKTLSSEFRKLSIGEQRQTWIDAGNFIRGSMAMKGMYNCCLEKPCWYCIYKTPGHGEGAACQCRRDILNGEHPCGECIGEILEGHGLNDLAPYYAKAISHKVGEQHHEHLKEIIADMYGITVEEQV